MPSGSGQQEWIGFCIFPGFCWVLGQLGERVQNFHHQRRFLVLSEYCLVNFCPHPSRRHRHSFKIFKGFWPAALLSLPLITPPQHRHLSQRICCCLASFWSAMMAYSHHCRRCMMVHSLLLRGRCIFSNFRWEQRSKQFPLTASSPATPRRTRRPRSRPAEVVRRTPPNHQ
jgi:hypothetical protein